MFSHAPKCLIFYLPHLSKNLTTLICVFLAIILTSCSSFFSPTPPHSSAVWNERNKPDPVSIVVPKGWVWKEHVDGAAYSIRISSSNDAQGWEGIIVHNYSPKVAQMSGPDADVKAKRDLYMQNDAARKFGEYVTPLGPKTIGDAQAWGHTSMAIQPDKKVYPSQEWLLWREDGLWKIRIIGFEGTKTIPSELIQAIDTIRFFPPFPTLPPDPTLLPTGTPS